LGAHQKNARRWQATLVFLDESGLLLTPLVRRTWGLRGQTPLLMTNARRDRRVSAIGAITISPARRRVRSYVRLHPNISIKQPEIISFLREQMRHHRGRIIVIRDRLNVHRGRAVKAFVAKHARLHLEELPSYAPELNPVEGMWGHGKGHKLANDCPDSVDDLVGTAHDKFHEYQTEQDLLKGFIRQTKLPLRL
jgi:putative transposase